MRPLVLAFLAAIFTTTQGLVGIGEVGRLPALGFNSWNMIGCGVTEQVILEAGEKIVSLGLKNAGYEYVNIDDCWSTRGENERDPETGYLNPDLNKFPNGIKGLADQIHSLGLKFGIYSSGTLRTCQDYPASLGSEDTDARAFAEWGVDYLKYDNCNIEQIPEWHDQCDYCQSLNSTDKCSQPRYCPPGFDYSSSKTAERFNRMREALAKVDRPIFYSLCEWGMANVAVWANETAQSWRQTGDIEGSWDSILKIINEASFYLNYVGFGSHMDMDMLIIGKNLLSYEEERTHMAIWSVMKSPILIGTHLEWIHEDSLNLLKAKTLLAFNQDDIFGAPVKPFKWGSSPDWRFDKEHPPEYYSGRFKQGILLVLFNTREDQRRYLDFVWDQIPEVEVGRMYRIVDGWNEDIDYGCYGAEQGKTFRIGPVVSHDTALLVLTEDSDCDVRNKYSPRKRTIQSDYLVIEDTRRGIKTL